jgi:hypothetical protein
VTDDGFCNQSRNAVAAGLTAMHMVSFMASPLAAQTPADFAQGCLRYFSIASFRRSNQSVAADQSISRRRPSIWQGAHR